MSQNPDETALEVPGPLRAMATRLGMENSAVAQVLAATVCQGATQEEVVAFAIVANEHHLNPFKKEIYAFPKKGGGLVPMAPIDGWTNIVNHRPSFDGSESSQIIRRYFTHLLRPFENQSLCH